MKDLQQYIESGILEAYVIGALEQQEMHEVEILADLHSEIRKEIEILQLVLEKQARENAIAPHPALKPMVFAVMDYTERMEKGEKPSYPPVIHEHSSIDDYKDWLEREDMNAPADYDGIFAKLIGVSAEVTSAIVWIKTLAPAEVHDNEYEKFLIVEGSCDIVVGSTTYHMNPGDTFSVPLHEPHYVTVTSSMPCKVILQRVAA